MAGSPPELPEIGTVVTSLKEGTTMTRFYASNKRPETRIFLLKLEEFQIAWWRYPGREEGVGNVPVYPAILEVLALRFGHNVSHNTQMCFLSFAFNWFR